MTGPRRQVLLVAAAMVVAPVAVAIVLLLHPGARAAGPAAHPGPPPPYPRSIVQNGIAYESEQIEIEAASVDPHDARLLYVFVDDDSDGSGAECRGLYPTVAVAGQDGASVTLSAADYTEKPVTPSTGEVSCYYAEDHLIRLRLRLDAPLGGRYLWDDVVKHRVHRVDPHTQCLNIVSCHP